MLAIAHPKFDRAREHCRVAAAMALDSGRPSAHPLVDALVFRPGKLRSEFAAFIRDGSLLPFSELKCLASLRARLRLIPLVETYIEARHKEIKAEGKHGTIFPARAYLSG